MSRSLGQGEVRGPGRKLTITDDKFAVKILDIYPENGFELKTDKDGVQLKDTDGRAIPDRTKPKPAENDMFIVEYPLGQIQHHQCRNEKAFIGRIKVFLRDRYELDKFSFSSVPNTIGPGSEITVTKE